MLKRVKQLSQEKGFTIIEVLIVLAIAALILLIIFLAVPALQRNSRNTQRKEDAAGALSGINEFVTNNNGTAPTTCSGTGTIIWGTAATQTTAETKVGYYNIGCVTTAPVKGNVYLAASGTAVAAGVFVDAAHDYVQIAAGTKCGASEAVVPGSTRQLSAVYALENTSGGYAQQCVAS